MFKGYHLLLKAHASKVNEKAAEIPDASLDLGGASFKASVSHSGLYLPPVQAPKFKDIKTQEDIQHVGQGKKFIAEMFPKSYYLGE